MSRPMGAHLLECSGNNNPGELRLDERRGVGRCAARRCRSPGSRSAATRPRCSSSGIDPERRSSAGSTAGASWVIPLASLDRLGAFLAVRMNGEPLPLDHGRPVRLVVPGWYGCAWIKWVNEIRLVGADEPATSQMKEFAGRTHRSARHDVARDYAPADIHAAALPVRIEKRQTAAGIDYRIVGIVWGGRRRSIVLRSVSIRLRRGEASRSVRRRRLTRSGRSGSFAGSRKSQGSTAFSCASPTNPFLSDDSIPATTCGKSLSECAGARGSGLGTRGSEIG